MLFEWLHRSTLGEGGRGPGGEQTFCQKLIFDKMPKIVSGHNGKKIFPKYRLGTKYQIFFFLIFIS
jgi:hypothetical protein